MNTFKKLGAALFGTALALGAMTACQEYDAPRLDAPVATMQANTTILELKKEFWDEATNYIWGTPQQQDATPTAIPARADGSHYIIKGTVVSSDEAGNVFKSLVIQDQTAALAISINSYNLYLNYRRGQEVVIDVTGMYAGKYNGLFQLGAPEWYENGNAWEASFMAPETFNSHTEVNGWPNLAAVDTIEVNAFSQLSTDLDGLQKWQSQLVKLNNVYFLNGGVEQFSEYHSSGVNQSLMDSEGNTLIVRTSGYSNFWNKMLPQGNFDLVCIASYYGTQGWQLIMIDYEGCMNIGNPTASPGVENNPWTVNEAITEIKAGRTPTGWVTGYIVGAVAPEVASVTSNSNIEWTSTPILDNTIVIGQTADTKDIANALVLELTPGSALYTYGNLVDNPDVYGKQIWVRGTMSTVMDTYGISGNNGNAGTWKIDGVEAGGPAENGDGTKDSPYNTSQVIAMNPSSTTEAVESGVWVTGYIVGYMPSTNTYLDNAIFSAAGAGNTNLVLGPTADCTDSSKCISIQLPTGAVRNALNLQANPGNLGAEVSLYGDVMKYCGGPGLKNVSDYVIENEGNGGGGDTPVTPPAGNGDGTETNPWTCADIQAMNPQSSDPIASGWVKGYIVGWADMSTVFYINDQTVRFTVPATMATNILLADTPTATAYTQCIGIQLPSGAIRNALNLQNNPGNLGKEVLIKGDVAKYSGVPGIRGASDYQFDGNGGGNQGGGDEPTVPTPPEGVYTVAQALAVINSGNIPTDAVQVQGIISSITEVSTSFGNATYIIKDSMSDSNGLTVYRGYYLDGAKFTSTDQIAVGGIVVVEGTLVLYNGTTPEVSTGNKIVSYTSPDGDTGGGNQGGGDEPAEPSGDYKGDFDTFNGGKAVQSPYGTYTNATGWTLNNGIVLGGTDGADSNPYFQFIGGPGVLAPTLNGKAGSAGTLTSPLLKGGISTLTFKYGFAFSETQCSFTVNVKNASGNIVKTDTVDMSSVQQKYAYSYSLEVNYTGDFIIEIVNNCKSAATTNKDRVSIWNLTWD